MAKPKIPNQKKKYQELNGRLNRYVALVEQIYDTLNLEAAKAVSRTKYSPDSDKPFKWSDYPQTKKQIDDIQKHFVEDINATIYRGTTEEWKNSNEAQDLIANKVLKAYNAQVDKEKYKVLYQTNSDALKAFQNRKYICKTLATIYDLQRRTGGRDLMRYSKRNQCCYVE